jgi:hypothetical protein
VRPVLPPNNGRVSDRASIMFGVARVFVSAEFVTFFNIFIYLEKIAPHFYIRCRPAPVQNRISGNS